MVRALQQALDGARAFLANEASELRDNRAARGFSAEGKAGDGDDQQQQWREREQGVVGQRGAHAGGVVVVPGRHRLPGESPQPWPFVALGGGFLLHGAQRSNAHTSGVASRGYHGHRWRFRVIWAHAQSRAVVPGWTPVEPVAPTVISDGDIGFRLLGMRGQTPVGQWVVRINGEWKNVEAGGDPHFQMR